MRGSDGLSAWARLPRDGRYAVIVVPGANMVGPDLANWIGNGARVLIATDADPARSTWFSEGQGPQILARRPPADLFGF